MYPSLEQEFMAGEAPAMNWKPVVQSTVLLYNAKAPAQMLASVVLIPNMPEGGTGTVNQTSFVNEPAQFAWNDGPGHPMLGVSGEAFKPPMVVGVAPSVVALTGVEQALESGSGKLEGVHGGLSFAGTGFGPRFSTVAVTLEVIIADGPQPPMNA